MPLKSVLYPTNRRLLPQIQRVAYTLGMHQAYCSRVAHLTLLQLTLKKPGAAAAADA